MPKLLHQLTTVLPLLLAKTSKIAVTPNKSWKRSKKYSKRGSREVKECSTSMLLTTSQTFTKSLKGTLRSTRILLWFITISIKGRLPRIRKQMSSKIQTITKTHLGPIVRPRNSRRDSLKRRLVLASALKKYLLTWMLSMLS